jgi:hypothetical protein
MAGPRGSFERKCCCRSDKKQSGLLIRFTIEQQLQAVFSETRVEQGPQRFRSELREIEGLANDRVRRLLPKRGDASAKSSHLVEPQPWLKRFDLGSPHSFAA